jgi:carboxyl-terminal processing protease
MKQARRLVWFVLSTVVLCALLGGAYGRRVEATTAGGDDSDVQASLKMFTKIYDVVEANYADPIDPDKVISPRFAKNRRENTLVLECRSSRVPARWAS